MDPQVYWATRRQKGYFLWEIGRNQENIAEFLPLVEAGSTEIEEWICLIQALSFAEHFDDAWKWAQKAGENFPESATLHIYMGDILRSKKCYEDAFFHWNRARELEPEWCDAAYSIAACYEEIGDLVNACEVYDQIADDLKSRGFDAEVSWPRALAHRCREKMTK